MRSIIVICISVLLFSCTDETEKKVIVCWGSSSVMPHKDYGIKGNIKKWLSGNFIDDSYPGFMEDDLGEKYKIVNCGVGGENSLTIAGRQGSIPIFISQIVTFEKGIDEVSIENSILRSSWDSSTVAPLHQSRWKEGSPARINPCTIEQQNMLLKCKRIEEKDKPQFYYTLERTRNTNQKLILKNGSFISTEASRHLRAPYLNIFHVGNNGGYKSISDFILQLKQMIKYGKCSRYIIISPHKTNASIKTIDELKNMEDSLFYTFGSHFINLRKYMVDKGLRDASMTPSKKDIDYIRKGQVPPQLMTDGTHFNAQANRIIASLVERKMQELGY